MYPYQIKSLDEYKTAYKKSIEDPEGFWDEVASHFHWRKKWDKVLEWNFTEPSIRWFNNAKLNITENCIDRHLEALGDKPAIIWEPNDPEYFERLKHIQKPEFLWIGCSDSRVPANEITGTQPGEIFVHRNVANMVVHTDVNLLSVLDFAVTHLKVKHIIVCGHYGCGGIKAAITNHDFKYVLNMWLRNIKDVYRLYRDELDAIGDEELKANRLTELNVREQVMHLAKTSIIQRTWKYEQRPDLHGWVYGLDNGIIKPVFEMKAGTQIDPLYQYEDL